MDIIQIYFLLGSFSIGYGLLRTGFPLSQQYPLAKKFVASYVIGLVIIGIALLSNTAMQTENFYVLAIIFTASAFTLLYAKRKIFNETDPQIIVEKKTRIMQDDIITQKEELGTKQKITFEGGLIVKGKQGEETKTKKQVFKEKESNILNTIENKTSELEGEAEKKRKNEILEKLRNSARQISDTTKKKTAKETEEEIEEDLLSDIGEEKTTGEEEY